MSKEAKYRTITSLLMGPVLIFVVILGGVPFLLTIILITLFAYLEINNMIEYAGFMPAKMLGFFTVTLFVIGAYFKVEIVLLVFTILLMGSLFWARKPKESNENFLGNLSTTFLGVSYA